MVHQNSVTSKWNGKALIGTARINNIKHDMILNPRAPATSEGQKFVSYGTARYPDYRYPGLVRSIDKQNQSPDFS